MMSESDWARLDRKFETLERKIDAKDSKVHKLEMEMVSLSAGSPHKCEEAIKAHEAGSLYHNPKKAIGMGVSIVTLWEGVRAFFHR